MLAIKKGEYFGNSRDNNKIYKLYIANNNSRDVLGIL